jgi:hypothetical protein
MKKIYIVVAFLFVTATFFGQELSLSVTGNANFDNSRYSVSEAGEDFSSSVTSESSAFVSLNYVNMWDIIFGTDIKWRIFIHKSDISWHRDLTLETKRNGNGTKASWLGPSPTVNHGTNYQDITNTPVYFFRGRYGVTDIPIGFRLSGASLSMGASQFETTIVFTVYDDW